MVSGMFIVTEYGVHSREWNNSCGQITFGSTVICKADLPFSPPFEEGGHGIVKRLNESR